MHERTAQLPIANRARGVFECGVCVHVHIVGFAFVSVPLCAASQLVV